MINNLVLYGAGKRGRGMYEFLKKCGIKIYGYCDRNADKIKEIDGIKVYRPEELADVDVIFCLTILNEQDRNQIRQELKGKEVIDFSDLPCLLGMDRVEFNRNFCADYHVMGMNDYYESGENLLDIFWSEDSIIYEKFQKLDITRVVELGCGRGRHVTQYYNRADEIMLVDILQNNIDFCKARFANLDNIKFYKNNGYNLLELKDNYYTALYSYDAMVHFEMMDIYSYLKEIHRILIKGGRALIHHSNYDKNYKADFSNSPHSRSFMSKKLFAYLAWRSGFEIEEQTVFDWYEVKDLDCVTLLVKR